MTGLERSSKAWQTQGGVLTKEQAIPVLEWYYGEDRSRWRRHGNEMLSVIVIAALEAWNGL